MNYTIFNKLKEIVSGLLIFFILFSITFQIPLIYNFNSASAATQEYYDLVSIIVDKDIYPHIREDVQNYSKDIQGRLKQTKTVILPIDIDTNTIEIAQLLEGLYFEGYSSLDQSVDFNSALIGVVFVGDFTLPTVMFDNATSKSIMPYTDFMDRGFVYDYKTEVFNYRDTDQNLLHPEIWHGVIAPNSGDKETDINQIKTYFNKNHIFYNWNKFYEQNCKSDDEDDDLPKECNYYNAGLTGENEYVDNKYTPYVFYYNQYQENDATVDETFKMFQKTRENIEDIMYERFNENLLSRMDTTGNMDVKNIPDYQAGKAIKALMRVYVETFNPSILGEMKGFVQNAGRYNNGSQKVNVDLIPFIITRLDKYSDDMRKLGNDVDYQVINSRVFSRIARPVYLYEGSSINIPSGNKFRVDSCDQNAYVNSFYGKDASSIESASECSIFLGTPNEKGYKNFGYKQGFGAVLTESNRGFNSALAENDSNACRGETRGYWAGNSIVNMEEIDGKYIVLNDRNYDLGIRPLKDIAGSQESKISSEKERTYLDCFDGRVLAVQDPSDSFFSIFSDDDNECRMGTRLPFPNGVNQRGGRFSCSTNLNKHLAIGENFMKNLPSKYEIDGSYKLKEKDAFEKKYNELKSFTPSGPRIGKKCILEELYFNDKKVEYSKYYHIPPADEDEDEEEEECLPTIRHYFKTIDSIVDHVSPTQQEISVHKSTKITPSLAIDDPRYISFKSKDGEKLELEYINFMGEPSSSLQLSQIINKAVCKLTPDPFEDELTSKGYYDKPEYEKGEKVACAGGDFVMNLIGDLRGPVQWSKFWYRMQDENSRYKYILNNFLADSSTSGGSNPPESKPFYEVNYIVAPGDVNGMHINMSHENKAENPYSDIAMKAEEIKLSAKSSIANYEGINKNKYRVNSGSGSSASIGTTNQNFDISKMGSGSSSGVCGPDSGVPIYEWGGAISCWVQDSLNNSGIKAPSGACSSKLIAPEIWEKFSACGQDSDNNGIDDCSENISTDEELVLKIENNKEVFAAGSNGAIALKLTDKDGNTRFYDSTSKIKFEVVSMNGSAPTENEIQEYISFIDEVQLVNGEAKFYFNSRNKEATITLRAMLGDTELSVFDIVIEKSSYELFPFTVTEYLPGEYSKDFTSTFEVNTESNITLIDENNSRIDEVLKIGDYQQNHVFVSIRNNAGDINYPLDLEVKDQIGVSKKTLKVNNAEELLQADLNGIFTTSGEYTIEISDNSGSQSSLNLIATHGKLTSLVLDSSTNVQEKNGTISAHTIKLFDDYDNLVYGEPYTINIDVSKADGLQLAAQEDIDSISQTTFDGTLAFTLKSTDSTGSWDVPLEVSDVNGNVVLSDSINLSVIDKITSKARVNTAGGINVQGNPVAVDFMLYDSSGNNKLENFNGIAAIEADPESIVLEENTFEIKNGAGRFIFTPGIKSGDNIPISIKIDGVRGIHSFHIKIEADQAMWIDVNQTLDRINADVEANNNNVSRVYVTLRDRYNNIVQDSSKEVELTLQNPLSLGPDSFSRNTTKKFNNGIAYFDIYGNKYGLVGFGQYKVKLLDDISSNTYEAEVLSDIDISSLGSEFYKDGELTDLGNSLIYITNSYSTDNINNNIDVDNNLTFVDTKNTKYNFRYSSFDSYTSTVDYSNLSEAQKEAVKNLYANAEKQIIEGVSENAGQIETYNLWDASYNAKNGYNTLYSVLLGANYGDFTQKGYMASNILFGENSKGLTVTSILNQPKKYESVLTILQKGAIHRSLVQNPLNDISIYPEIQGNTIEFQIRNELLGENVASIYHKYIQPTSSFEICEIGGLCDGKNDDDVITINFYKNKDIDVVDNTTLIDKYSESILSINNNKIEMISNNYHLELLDSYAGKNRLGIFSDSGQQIGSIEYTLDGAGMSYSTKEEIIMQRLGSNNNDVAVLIKSPIYGIEETIASGKNTTFTLYMKDVYSDIDTKNTTDQFNKHVDSDLFFADEEYGLGWKRGNIAMLEFAAGTNVGDATKNNSSFSLINLGDPVLRLNDKQTKFSSGEIKSFDQTVGKRVYNSEKMHSYFTGNIDKNTREDIFVIRNDGFIDLLLHTGTDKGWRNIGSLVLPADRGRADLVNIGDFGGRGVSDIFFVNNDGKPNIYVNNNGKYSRVDVSELFGFQNKFVQQAKLFDMNADGSDDLIILDTDGELAIYYGGLENGNLHFSKKIISKSNFPALLGEESNEGGFVYYDGIEEYFNSKTSLENTTQEEAKKDHVVENIITVLSEKINLDNEILGDKDNPVTFIKSQYANAVGIDIKRKFIDENGGGLTPGDKVRVDINVTNNSSESIEDFIYSDGMNDILSYVPNSIKINTGNNVYALNDYVRDYEVSIGTQVFNPNDTISFSYYTTVEKFIYGDLEVGLLDTGENADNLGDISLDVSGADCHTKAMKFNSGDGYKNTDNPLVCEPSPTSEIPELSEANGILEEINALNDSAAGQNSGGATTAVNNIGDKDLSDNTRSTLEKINDEINSIDKDIDAIIDGLGCGFGGGSCIAMPLNWAPLAPGNDPVFMGKLVGDGLKVQEGIPIFSTFTWRPSSAGCVPTFFPRSKRGAGCGASSAGGKYGTWDASNRLRIFVTPTLTGAIGTAVCLNGPASVVGNTPPKGASPVVPGGNCIVIAKPLLGCSDELGDPSSQGNTNYVPPSTSNNVGSSGSEGSSTSTQPSGYSIIQPKNCKSNSAVIGTNNIPFDAQKLSALLRYNNGDRGSDVMNIIDGLENDFAKTNHNYGSLPSTPLVRLGSGETGAMSTSVKLDLGALGKGSFSDVIQIENKRTDAFPDFFMNWITDQFEEVVNKLTDLPKIVVILPDMESTMDLDMTDFGEKVEEARIKTHEKNEEIKRSYNERIQDIEQELEANNCSTLSTGICLGLESQKNSLERSVINNTNGEGLSSMRAVYEYMGNIPFVNIEPEVVNIDIPWADGQTLTRAKVDFEAAAAQWRNEANKYSEYINAECVDTDTDCINHKAAGEKLYLEATALANSIELNIQRLEEYKRFPEKVRNLLNKKEEWLYQILCNIDVITEITNGWINRNAARFEAWVRTYVLIKAILKSWQVFIDIFKGYEYQCHQCKNERQDSIGGIFEMISAVIPSAPIIEFPKWPDITIDLHNIRAGINIKVPDFSINARPIRLPVMPNLRLPDVPTTSLSLPDIPVLPALPDLPELPDLPSLPSIKLPDLPPPIKIPKLFGAADGMLEIGKIIIKAMCILKFSPFVPEWRAGDQIAYITERSGYLPLDFFSLEGPKFDSYSAISSINITTYVNLEKDTNLLVDSLKEITKPLNAFTSDAVNYFDRSLGDLDFSSYTPEDKHYDLEVMKLQEDLTESLFANLPTWHQYFSNLSRQELDHKEFQRYMSKNLALASNNGHPEVRKLQKLWENIGDVEAKEASVLTQKLIDQNRDKMQVVEEILEAEMEYTRSQADELLKLQEFDGYFKVSKSESDRFDTYSKKLKDSQDNYKAAVVSLLDQEATAIEKEISNEGEKLLAASKELALNVSPQTTNNTLPAAGLANNTSSNQSCGVENNPNSPSYVYKGIYIEENEKHYRLFTYLDELLGDEEVKYFDADQDGDMDILYEMNNSIYFKKNHNIKPEISKDYAGGTIMPESENIFMQDKAYPAITAGYESGTHNGQISINIEDLKNKPSKHFGIIINQDPKTYQQGSNDKYIYADVFNDRFIQESYFADIGGTVKKHPVYLDKVPNNDNIKILTKEYADLKEDISDNKTVVVDKGRELYAPYNSDVLIEYSQGNNEAKLTYTLQKGHSIRFDQTIRITGLTNSLYVFSEYRDVIIPATQLAAKKLPLIHGIKIFSDKTEDFRTDEYIKVVYSNDDSSTFDLQTYYDYRFIIVEDQLDDTITVPIDLANGFYYARVGIIEKGKDSVFGNQILFTPQKEADIMPPEFNMSEQLRLPIYKVYKIKLTGAIYEDSGLNNIEDFSIDLDAEIDSDGDFIEGNDRDIVLGESGDENFVLKKTGNDFYLYINNITAPKVMKMNVMLRDGNNNTSSNPLNIDFFVPTPQISALEEKSVQGYVQNNIDSQPVRLYRIRNNSIGLLTDNDANKIFTSDNQGQYLAKELMNSSIANVRQENDDLIQIDENTGGVKNSSVEIETKLNNKNTPELVLRNLDNGQEVGRFVWQIASISDFVDVSGIDFDQIQDNELGIYMMDETIVTQKLPLGIPYNSGAYIMQKGDKIVATILRDGQILLEEEYELQYQGNENGLILQIKEKDSANIIAKLLSNNKVRIIQE